MSGLASHPNHFPIHQGSKIISPDTLKCNRNLPISISHIFLENKGLQRVHDIFAQGLKHRSWQMFQRPRIDILLTAVLNEASCILSIGAQLQNK